MARDSGSRSTENCRGRKSEPKFPAPAGVDADRGQAQDARYQDHKGEQRDPHGTSPRWRVIARADNLENLTRERGSGSWVPDGGAVMSNSRVPSFDLERPSCSAAASSSLRGGPEIRTTICFSRFVFGIAAPLQDRFAARSIATQRTEQVPIFSGVGREVCQRYNWDMVKGRRTRSWSVEERAESFIVRDVSGRRLGDFHFYLKPDRLAPNHLTRDEARLRAVNFAKLPGLLARRPT